ncbi:MAG TPA: hypothetical protein VH540_23380 [Ktedonobacterales bacterium]|jgi:hypothetical protein
MPGKNALKLFLFLLVVFVAAALYVSGGLRAYQLFQRNYSLYGQGACGAEFSWKINPQALAANNGQSELLTGFYTNLPWLVSVSYRSATPQQLTLSAQIPNFSQEQPIEVEATSGWKEQLFHPPVLPGMIDTLANISYRDSQVLLRVAGASGKSCTDSKPLRLLTSRAMYWQNTQGQDNFSFLAAWVTPQDPAIRDLVNRAAERLKNDPALYPNTTEMVGYAGSQQDVINQVNAIYDTLEQEYHIHYSNTTIQYGPTIENVLLPKDLLQSGTGMCVETTITLASAIESLHMRPYIYIVPGHAFLGVAMGPESTDRRFWETTLLGQGVYGKQANQSGMQEHDEMASQIIRVIDIVAERQQGILPME